MLPSVWTNTCGSVVAITSSLPDIVLLRPPIASNKLPRKFSLLFPSIFYFLISIPSDSKESLPIVSISMVDDALHHVLVRLVGNQRARCLV
jgi:hypothetical protein